MDSIGPSLTRTCDGTCQGAQTTGFDGPNNTTTGIPNAAAIWAGPLSFPAKIVAADRRFLTSCRCAPATVRKSEKADASSEGPARKTGSTPIFFRCSATATKEAAGHVLPGADANG